MGRRIEAIVHLLPPVAEDPTLLHQVWRRLICSAIKLRSKKELARIKKGCERTGSGNKYFGMDIGAGLDMCYCSKLFGLFQRLRGVREFEGTGEGVRGHPRGRVPDQRLSYEYLDLAYHAGKESLAIAVLSPRFRAELAWSPTLLGPRLRK
jgi:hypothetical protein